MKQPSRNMKKSQPTYDLTQEDTMQGEVAEELPNQEDYLQKNKPGFARSNSLISSLNQQILLEFKKRKEEPIKNKKLFT
jgi:hypothetical protein